MVAKHQARIGNWRLDSVGRLVEKYRSNASLNECWDAALSAGIPPEECNPEGSTNPQAPVPTDGLFSEFILRAFEAAYDKPNANDPFPGNGFRANLRAIAENLETACRIAVEGFKVAELSAELIPLDWLATAAEFHWYQLAPGVADPRLAITKDLQAENGPYPYLGALWQAWSLAPKPSSFVYGDGSGW